MMTIQRSDDLPVVTHNVTEGQGQLATTYGILKME